MAYDPKNINLGPCRVRWGGVDLGMTKGGVEVELTTDTYEITTDQFGNTPLNEYIIGRQLSITCPFVETDIDTLHRLLNKAGSTVVDDGARATGTIAVTTLPVANDTVVVNGTTFTFVVSPTLPTHVKIGASVAASYQNLLDVLQFSTAPGVVAASYTPSSAANTIDVTHLVAGVAGNSFTLAKTGTSVTVSGATLAGGIASTRKKVVLASGVGTSLLDGAQELVLRPYASADNDFSKDFVVPLAGTSGALSFAYKLDEEKLYNMTFKGYANPVTRTLFVYGDKRTS